MGVFLVVLRLLFHALHVVSCLYVVMWCSYILFHFRGDLINKKILLILSKIILLKCFKISIFLIGLQGYHTHSVFCLNLSEACNAFSVTWMLLTHYDGTLWTVNRLQGHNLKTMHFGTSVIIVYLIKMTQTIKWHQTKIQ